jgi:CheY-like chemotaxis protein
MDGLSHLSVVVADHDAWSRSYLALTLEGIGAEVREASNGMTALRLATLHSPHVVILGLALPELGGQELVHELRSQPRTRDAAVIGLGGLTDVDATLQQPYRPVDVLASVVEALEARRQALAAAAPIRSVIASPRGTWPLLEAASSRSSSSTRNAGRSAKWRLSSGIETL